MGLKTGLAGGLTLAAVLAVQGGAAAAEPPGAAAAQAIIKERCTTCHERQADGTLNRIDHVRKTPEGWTMTLFRMNQIHGANLTPEESRKLVAYLSDRQGLAPEEAAPFRYILERQPSVVETPIAEGDLSVTCGRCHSIARVGLQRRDADEWRRLAHFHLGQWPTAEYQALGRDRKWWEIVSTRTPTLLGSKFPFQTKEWTAWAKAPKPELAGTWTVSGHRPGLGSYGGTATVTRDGDGYSVAYDLTDAAGKPLSGKGRSVVYTGYEWRGSTTLGGQEVREVFAASKDGRRMTGRWFLADHDEIGASFTAVKAEAGAPAILGYSQESLKAGTTARITVWGTGLDGGTADFGPGVTAKVVSQAPGAVVVEATAAAGAAPGARKVTVGKARGDGFTVYAKIDSVQVEPPYTIARVGGNGGTTAPVTAQFEAVGYLNGKDGKPGTRDDVRVGPLPADWSLEPYNEAAKQMEDVKFSGGIGPSGLFQPAAAGPNPQRVFGTNNIGDLKVVATVRDGEHGVSGSGRLISTVQRWNDPPIR
ncbi:quinohemoprotein amine dehydrogenase subunit alpha [Azospirillum thermophilum]|uniref:Quinohemoprotein amine dehydrogenase subunit alpha n=1 Tax=Azospirillum thermophilum TaxID=2202148 RepID=A0A2S2CK80_9PROT|nr:quinohemoprotein amine dehydrogenase subunit alpha [Azospirillum thermophilum]AWK84882.1 quinohemoprotein amine dehydrogenase subunit alpha [Azospirillum thermophilum]